MLDSSVHTIYESLISMYSFMLLRMASSGIKLNDRYHLRESSSIIFACWWCTSNWYSLLQVIWSSPEGWAHNRVYHTRPSPEDSCIVYRSPPSWGISKSSGAAVHWSLAKSFLCYNSGNIWALSVHSAVGAVWLRRMRTLPCSFCFNTWICTPKTASSPPGLLVWYHLPSSSLDMYCFSAATP